jgi:glycosyltransferase involved in cell wall biosynthesis
MDAVEYFVNEIFPLARKNRPDLKFVVVGRKPPKHIRDLGKLDGVTITGTVDDVRPFLASAALYVVPLRIGGGSRLKILEAMAMQKAVLSTTVGAEGLNLSPSENIVIRDEPAQFAEAIIQYIDDTETTSRIAQQGRELVEREYGWQRLGEKLHRYIIKVVQS